MNTFQKLMILFIIALSLLFPGTSLADSTYVSYTNETPWLLVEEDVKYSDEVFNFFNSLADKFKVMILSSDLKIILLNSNTGIEEIYHLKKKVLSGYDYLSRTENIESASEYFATSFAAYFLFPNDLSDNCPLTYAFFQFFCFES